MTKYTVSKDITLTITVKADTPQEAINTAFAQPDDQWEQTFAGADLWTDDQMIDHNEWVMP